MLAVDTGQRGRLAAYIARFYHIFRRAFESYLIATVSFLVCIRSFLDYHGWLENIFLECCDLVFCLYLVTSLHNGAGPDSPAATSALGPSWWRNGSAGQQRVVPWYNPAAMLGTLHTWTLGGDFDELSPENELRSLQHAMPVALLVPTPAWIASRYKHSNMQLGFPLTGPFER